MDPATQSLYVDLATMTGPVGTLVLGAAWWIRSGLDSLKLELIELRARVQQVHEGHHQTEREVVELRTAVAELRAAPRGVLRDVSTPLDVGGRA